MIKDQWTKVLFNIGDDREEIEQIEVRQAPSKPRPKAKPAKSSDPFMAEKGEGEKDTLRARIPTKSVFDFKVRPASNIDPAAEKDKSAESRRKFDTYYKNLKAPGSNSKPLVKKVNYNGL
jgi:hypothetical protein